MTDIVKHQPLDFVTSGSHPGSSWILYSNTKSPAAVSLVTGTTLNMIIMKLNNQIRKLKKNTIQSGRLRRYPILRKGVELSGQCKLYTGRISKLEATLA